MQYSFHITRNSLSLLRDTDVSYQSNLRITLEQFENIAIDLIELNLYYVHFKICRISFFCDIAVSLAVRDLVCVVYSWHVTWLDLRYYTILLALLHVAVRC